MTTTKIKSIEVMPADLSDVEGVDIVAEEKPDVGSRDPIPEAKRRQAFELYMRNKRMSDIAMATGIKKGTILSWMTRERWAEKRKEANALNIADVLETKKVLLNDITVEMLEGITATIKNAKDSKGAFKIKELPTFLSAVGNLEKLSRLALGMATSISEERSKRAQFSIPLEHLKDANLVKVQDPFAATLPAPTEAEKPHPEEDEDDE